MASMMIQSHLLIYFYSLGNVDNKSHFDLYNLSLIEELYSKIRLTQFTQIGGLA